MDFLETPAERFRGLPDYPWEPQLAQVDPSGLRMAYLDEGPEDGPIVLLMHGEPSWSYLYRFMIPGFVDAGCRVIAPDLIGFGRSSKPMRIQDHSYARHVEWVKRLVARLDLSAVTLFAQDWGALIGLRVAAEMEERFARIAIGNGFLPKGDPPEISLKALGSAAAFLTWRTFAKLTPVFVASSIVDLGSARELSTEERYAYDAPFPDHRYLAGARAMPQLVPLSPRDPARPANLAAWEVFERWDKPFLTLFSTGDPITRGLDRVLQRKIPGAAGQPHHRVRGGHFLQEDAGPELTERVLTFMGD